MTHRRRPTTGLFLVGLLVAACGSTVTPAPASGPTGSGPAGGAAAPTRGGTVTMSMFEARHARPDVRRNRGRPGSVHQQASGCMTSTPRHLGPSSRASPDLADGSPCHRHQDGSSQRRRPGVRPSSRLGATDAGSRRAARHVASRPRAAASSTRQPLVARRHAGDRAGSQSPTQDQRPDSGPTGRRPSVVAVAGSPSPWRDPRHTTPARLPRQSSSPIATDRPAHLRRRPAGVEVATTEGGARDRRS